MDVSNAVARRAFVLVVAVGLLGSMASVGAVATHTTPRHAASADTGILAAQNGTNATVAGAGEPNDDRANATPIRFEDTAVAGISQANVSGFDNETSPANTGPGDPADWLSFEVKKGEAIRAWGYGFLNTDANASLVGPDGTKLTGLTGGGDDHPLGVVADESGTYYIHVRSDPPTHATGYEVDVQVAEAGRFEPNDDRDSATPVTPKERGTTTLAPSSETDWYAVNADDGASINATLRSLSYESGGPVLTAGLSVDIFTVSGERIGTPVKIPSADSSDEKPTNGTIKPGSVYGVSPAVVVAESVREGTYYVRVSGPPANEFGSSFGFSPYSLTVSGDGLRKPGSESENGSPTTTATSPKTQASDASDSLVVVGGSPENKVTYAFTYDGSVERSGTNHGAPIDDDGVTIDPDIDEITDSRVSGRVGGGGDAYLVTDNITGLRIDGNATAYLNGHAVDPDSFGDAPDRETATATETQTATSTTTSTATATATSTAASTATRTPTATPTRTVTPIAAATPTTAATTISSETRRSTRPNTTDENGSSGRVLTDTNDDATGSSGPGFGVAGSFAAVFVVCLFVLRRR